MSGGGLPPSGPGDEPSGPGERASRGGVRTSRPGLEPSPPPPGPSPPPPGPSPPPPARSPLPPPSVPTWPPSQPGPSQSTTPAPRKRIATEPVQDGQDDRVARMGSPEAPPRGAPSHHRKDGAPCLPWRQGGRPAGR